MTVISVLAFRVSLIVTLSDSLHIFHVSGQILISVQGIQLIIIPIIRITIIFLDNM